MRASSGVSSPVVSSRDLSRDEDAVLHHVEVFVAQSDSILIGGHAEHADAAVAPGGRLHRSGELGRAGAFHQVDDQRNPETGRRVEDVRPRPGWCQEPR